ncbi:hypothetical protein LCGC14_0373940 [marine sediment metagenome]|uniref:Uncharacterized protein n=1 Tax=marine sediment metagenome TaxID=412755 RepID=A0A0F9T429_9ZZZZ
MRFVRIIITPVGFVFIIMFLLATYFSSEGAMPPDELTDSFDFELMKDIVREVEVTATEKIINQNGSYTHFQEYIYAVVGAGIHMTLYPVYTLLIPFFGFVIHFTYNYLFLIEVIGWGFISLFFIYVLIWTIAIGYVLIKDYKEWKGKKKRRKK